MKPDCIIREPHGPVPHRNFKVGSYNLYPAEVNEFDYVVKQAYIPTEYIIKDTVIGKIQDNYIFYDIYFTKDGCLSFYKDKKLMQINYIPDNYFVFKKNIKKNKKTNYYLIISYDINRTRMYKFKTLKRRDDFYENLSSFISKRS